MSTTLAIRRRRALAKKGIGMPGNNDVILAVARKLREPVEVPVLGGIAVYLHGYLRATEDLDFYTPDRELTDVQLRAAGARWDAARREHILDDVRIHTVTPEDAGHIVEHTSIIDGIRVVSLKDLVAIKLLCGLEHGGRSKDVADVEELIRRIPLDKRFARKLPSSLRAPFKRLVDSVQFNERQQQGKPRF